MIKKNKHKGTHYGYPSLWYGIEGINRYDVVIYAPPLYGRYTENSSSRETYNHKSLECVLYL